MKSTKNFLITMACWLSMTNGLAASNLASWPLNHVANALGWQPTSVQENLCKGYYQEPASVLAYPNPPPISEAPTQITAEGPATFVANGVSILEKRVEVTQPGRSVKADKAFIYRTGKTGKVEKIILVGHVELREAGQLILGRRGSLTLYPREIVMVQSAYHLHEARAYGNSLGTFESWGTAQKSYRDRKAVIYLNQATYSTCNPEHPSWQLSGKQIILDRSINTGKIYNAVLKFKHIPLFYLPYYSFPLKKERKSGFLTPEVGYSTISGSDIAIPYYWNIAPNFDLTLTPEFYSERGFRISNYFRYLTPRSVGNIYLSFLPDDQMFNTFKQNALLTYSNRSVYPRVIYRPYLNALADMPDERTFFSMAHITQIDPAWRLKIDLNWVTDPYYFQDITNNYGLGSSTVNQLLNRIDLEYNGNHWNFSAFAQAYQTLHQINQTTPAALDQYQILPDLGLDGYFANILPHVDLESESEFSNFDYSSDFAPNRPIGQRLHWRPGISVPLYTDFLASNSQIWVDSVGYNTRHTQLEQLRTTGRILPIVDIDNRFYVDRRIDWGSRGYLQTFEPRLFYLYVPYQNQDRLPNFDTLLLPFSFDQLFSLNRFTGIDRLDNANQISLGLTTRFLDPSSAATLLSASLGASYYIEPSAVCLTENCAPSTQRFSPLVGELSYSLSPFWTLSGNAAYDVELKQMNNDGLSLRYSSDPNHMFLLGYTFVQENTSAIAPGLLSVPNNLYTISTSNLTAGVIWPLFQRWNSIGYADWNIEQRRMNNYFVGLQYDTCCWSLRLVAQRSYVGSTTSIQGGLSNQFDTSYYIQLILKGLGDIGTGNVNQLLRSTFPGFR